jgi:hypothetical protein
MLPCGIREDGPDSLYPCCPNCSSFVAGSGTGRRKSGTDGFTLGFVNFGGVEVFIQEHQKHGIPGLRYVDGAQTSFYLQTAYSAAGLFNCDITCLPGRRQLDAKNSGGFVFSDLSGDAERLSIIRTTMCLRLSRPTDMGTPEGMYIPCALAADSLLKGELHLC